VSIRFPPPTCCGATRQVAGLSRFCRPKPSGDAKPVSDGHQPIFEGGGSLAESRMRNGANHCFWRPPSPKHSARYPGRWVQFRCESVSNQLGRELSERTAGQERQSSKRCTAMPTPADSDLLEAASCVWGRKQVGTLFSPSPRDQYEPAARARKRCGIDRAGGKCGLVRSALTAQADRGGLDPQPEDTKREPRTTWLQEPLPLARPAGQMAPAAGLAGQLAGPFRSGAWLIEETGKANPWAARSRYWQAVPGTGLEAVACRWACASPPRPGTDSRRPVVGGSRPGGHAFEARD